MPSITALKFTDPTEYRRRRDIENERDRNNPQRNVRRDHQRRARTPEGRVGLLVCRARDRARENGLAHDIDAADLHIPMLCPVLGIPLGTAEDTPNANRFSLDRSDNRKGYVKGNVQIISFRANTLKNNATGAELRAIAAYVTALETLDEIIGP